MSGNLILPAPHDGQRAILSAILDRHLRFIDVAAGRRWRKTTLGIMIACLFCVDPAARERIHGLPVLWGAPTYDQCRVAWGELMHAAGGIVKPNMSRMEVTFPTGSRLMFRSLDDPNNARGHTAGLFIGDEIGFIKQAAWYDVIRPMLSDSQGIAVRMGTPNGMNWWWQETLAAEDRDDSAFFQAPTLGVEIVDHELLRRPHPLENPDFPFEEAVRMYATMPEQTFRQEFLAQFVEDSGGVFRGVSRVATLEPQEPIPGHDYVIGVDWARHHDWTVFATFDVDTQQQVALERHQEVDYAYQTGRLKALMTWYNPQIVVCEENAMGGPLIESLQDEGFPVWAQNTNVQTKRELIDGLSLNIERQHIGLLNDPVQTGELLAYEMNRTPHGFVKYGAPEGLHDDCVMALAMAVRALEYAGPAVVMI